MAGSFFGIHLGLSSLRAHQRALEVVGHNVANASNPAYSRQEAVLRAAPALVQGGELLGGGVLVREIRRAYDAFLVRQAWYQAAAEARARTREDLLKRVEDIFQEPSASGLQGLIDRFWGAWQELANQPEDPAVRQAVIERARTLVQAIRDADRQLAELAAEAAVAVDARVGEVNALARRVAEITADIVRAEVAGRNANDLKDARDELIGRLAELAGVTVQEGAGGRITVWLGGVPLVEGDHARELRADPQAGGGVQLTWPDTGAQGQPGGMLAAYLDFVNRAVPELRQRLLALVEALSDAVDAQHRQGMGLDGSTGRPFFTLAGSVASWDVHPDVAADPARIAAALPDSNPDPDPVQPGDGRNALNIAGLKDAPLVGGATVNEAYRAMVVSLGVQAQEAARRAETARLLRDQARRRVQEVSSVSLDEEMARMVELQHAYAAAARVITAVDEMLAVVVGRLGLVGR